MSIANKNRTKVKRLVNQVDARIKYLNGNNMPKSNLEKQWPRSCGLLAFFSFVGLLISVYGYYVEVKAESDSSYRAMCDISETISCTKVFSTPYGKGFGVVGKILGEDSVLNVPNGVFGLAFYSTLLLTAFNRSPMVTKFQLGLAVVSNSLSIYLAYLLYFVIENLCVVCVSLYGVNFFILLFSLWKYTISEQLVAERKYK